MLSRVVRHRPNLGVRVCYRFYSDKHQNIEEFKKHQTEYNFGQTLQRKPGGFGDIDSSEQSLRNDPSLAKLRYNSPEYKEQLHKLELESRGDQQRQRAYYEFMERMKAIGAGALALVGIMTTYQVVMNYKYIKAYFNAKWYHNWDDSFVKDLKDPKGNTKSLENLTEKLFSQIDDQFIDALKPSETTPGIYLFGAITKSKLPSRIPGFDSKYYQDVLVRNDLVVAVDEAGHVYQYTPDMKQPEKINTPTRISRVYSSGDTLYYLSHNQKDLYHGHLAPESKAKGWFHLSLGSSISKVSFEDLERGEKIGKIVAGENHLLVLTSKGRLFEVNTATSPNNKGQYGLPNFIPSNTNATIPINSAYELKNLNYEIVGSGDKKSVQQRVFNDIGAGSFHNIASDTKNNVWSWGDNAFSQCGIEAATIGDFQAVPRLVFSASDLRKLIKFSLPDQLANGSIQVNKVACQKETTLIKVTFNHDADRTKDQSLILAFGNGLKGQLGLSRYLHKIGQPHVIKSLVGMKEYNTVAKTSVNIGVKDIVCGGNHSFVLLDNEGESKDVLVFGDNLDGQFGNGKCVKSSKPLYIPKLLEPADFEGSKTELVKKFNDQDRNRLQLLESTINGQRIEQGFAAGEDSSAIFYKKR
ncbi:hypothetical protein PUMCH_000997 [Australozyma saopauloensis]|uniref:Protein FMP25, mitochondrial n=1 Tax=Australozyma saopauloensis TaxID=291208 RepID=A0AAX4H694_9ASCO|nr:hypothetical protein PUMCH_000997 [[Candida] saopauloensis]